MAGAGGKNTSPRRNGDTEISAEKMKRV